jgi:hypothetical protein
MEIDGHSSPASQTRLGDWVPTDSRERIGDTERSAVCDALSEHFAAGRLTPDDLDQRLNLAVHAVTRDDLHLLTADLPTIGTLPSRQPSPGRSLPALSVLAMVGLFGSLVVAGGLLVVLGAVSPVLFIGAWVGGTAAAVGGASAGYLIMQHVRIHRPDRR